MIEKNRDKINWTALSCNPSAIHLSQANRDKIDWWALCSNHNANQIHDCPNIPSSDYQYSTNPCSIPYYEENINEIDWSGLCRYPNAMSLLKKRQDKIDWIEMSANPSIFTFDYFFYKKRMNVHQEELMKQVFHPKRLFHYLNLGYDGFESI